MVGNLPLAQMDGNWIERWLETSSTKGVKRTRLLTIKPFFKWAVSMKLIATDPTVTIKVKVKESAGHATWTDEEVEQYRARHPLGTMARLALELMLNLASRRRSRIAEVMRAARTTKGRMPDYGRVRLHAARNYVGLRTYDPERSRAVHQSRQQQAAGRAGTCQGRQRRQRRAAAGGLSMKRRRTTEEIRESKRRLAEEVETIKRDMRRSLLAAWRDGRMERVFEEWAKEEEAERDKPSKKH
jgi:hypothetical protein